MILPKVYRFKLAAKEIKMEKPMAKFYHFDLVWGSDRNHPMELKSSEVRRLESFMKDLDSAAPQSEDIFSDGVLAFHWRKPPSEKDIVATLRFMGHDFWYRFVPDGNVHQEIDCDCGYIGPLRYGDICNAVPSDLDWKFISVD